MTSRFSESAASGAIFSDSLRNRAEQAVASGRRIRVSEFEAMEVPRKTVWRMVEAGLLEKVGPGAYRSPDAISQEWAALGDVAFCYPKATVCLMTAAALHGLTESLPYDLWVAMPPGSKISKSAFSVDVRTFYWSVPEAFELGVEVKEVDGVAVRVTDPIRTVCDLFKSPAVTSEDRIKAFGYLMDKNASPAEIYSMAERRGVLEEIEPLLQAHEHIGLNMRV